MSDDGSSVPIASVGEDLRNAMESGEYDRFLIFTYSISEEMLDWFPENSDVCICTRSSEAADIRESEYGEDIDFRERDTHAKLYLFWNNQEIRCWLGSFNFTESGFSSNVEWSGSFSGDLQIQLPLAKITEGNLPSVVTDDEMVNQVTDFANTILTHRQPKHADNIFDNLPQESVLVHTEYSNTLKRAVTRILSEATSATIRYYTPFINKSGVEEFASRFPEMLSKQDVSFEAYTARPEQAIGDQGTYIRSSHVNQLNRDFDSFILLTRSTGVEGQVLADEREIRDGFSHLKVVVLSYRTASREEKTETVLTTANLTQNAWQTHSGNLELGVWVREPVWNENLDEFYTENLSACYSRADDDEFEDIDRHISEAESGEVSREWWLEDFFEDRITFDSKKLSVSWEDWYPDLQGLSCRLYLKNLVSNKTTTHSVELNPESDGYTASVGDFHPTENTVVDFLEFEIETRFRPPQTELTTEQLSKLRAGDFDKIGGWDLLILNNSTYLREEISPSGIPEDVDFGAIRRLRETPTSATVRYQIDDQPLLPPQFFVRKETRSVVVAGTELPAVILETPNSLNPPFDSIQFELHADSDVRPIGFIRTDQGITYLFHPQAGGERVLVEPSTPFAEYYNNSSAEITLPSTSSESFELGDQITSTTLSHSVDSISNLPLEIEDTNRFISEASVQVRVPPSLREIVTENRIEYFSNPTGYFYHKPEISELSDSLQPRQPYERIQYRGAIRYDSDFGTARLLTETNSFVARKQLVDEIRLSFDGIPEAIPLSSIDSQSPIAWFVVDMDDIVVDDVAGGFHEYLTVDIWKNGSKLSTKPSFPVLRSGQIYCTPILKEVFSDSVIYHVVVRPENTDTRTRNFAWAAEEFTIKAAPHTGKRFKLQYGKGTVIISESSESSEPELDIDRLYQKRLARELEYISSHKLPDEHEPIIQPIDDSVLRFTEHQQ